MGGSIAGVQDAAQSDPPGETHSRCPSSAQFGPALNLRGGSGHLLRMPGVRFSGVLTQSGRNLFRDEGGVFIEFTMRPLKELVQKATSGDSSPEVTLGHTRPASREHALARFLHLGVPVATEPKVRSRSRVPQKLRLAGVYRP